MTIALVNARVVLDDCLREDVAVLIDGARISAVCAPSDIPHGTKQQDLAGATLAPGFIDVQVNGGGGVLFNDAPTVETIAAIGAAHRRFGTTGFLPTLISDDLEVVRAGIAAVDAAIAQGVPGVLGIHVEGPFLNVARKGIHDPARIRALDDEGMAALTSGRRGVTLTTLAPERTEPHRIAALAGAGVIVAAGHTNASYEQLREAIDCGITGVTHLFNAMSPLASRAPGAVGAALDDPRCWCGLIVDGQHVHPATMRIAAAAKGVERMILVSDAMPTVGHHEQSFTLQDHRVTAVGAACFNDDGTLAGSNLDMAAAVRNAQSMLGVSLPSAVRMASRNPAEFLGLEATVGRIAAGLRADLVALNSDGEVIATWIGGAAMAGDAAGEPVPA